MCAFIDHGRDGTGEPAAIALRAGNTAADHKTVLADALQQLPGQVSWRIGRKVLVRTDAGGGTHEFIDYCQARRVQYSLGFNSEGGYANGYLCRLDISLYGVLLPRGQFRQIGGDSQSAVCRP